MKLFFNEIFICADRTTMAWIYPPPFQLTRLELLHHALH